MEEFTCPSRIGTVSAQCHIVTPKQNNNSTIEAAKSAFDEGVKTLEGFTGAHVPKRQFEELVIRAAQDFEAFYVDRQAHARGDPHSGPVLVLTVDGKGVVLRPEDLREATRRAAEARVETFTARLGRGRRLHAKRMASVAAIYTVERFVRTPGEILPASAGPREAPTRPRPEHKRVWASLAHSPEEVITAMFDEAAHRDPRGKKRWVALVDGNRTQIDRPPLGWLQESTNRHFVPLLCAWKYPAWYRVRWRWRHFQPDKSDARPAGRLSETNGALAQIIATNAAHRVNS